jgi:CHAT domain-containing protein
LEAAEPHLRRAVALREQLSSSSVGTALAYRSLGVLRRRQGRVRQAVPLLRRAVETLEAQIEALGGSHRLPGSFRERYEPIYRQAIDAMVEIGEGSEAFGYLEKSRARSLLGMLAERDGPTRAPLPEGVERDLRSPLPVSLEEARSVLDAGTVALAYSVGEEKSLLFVVTPENGLERVVPIAVDRRELSYSVETLRRAVLRARHPRSAAFEVFEALSRKLFRLIAPAADLVDAADRVLVLPDGPLHLLPFGVLLDDGEAPRYLIERKPLFSVLSATLFAELRRRRPAIRRPAIRRPATRQPAAGHTPKETVAIFADPRYPEARTGETEWREAATPFDLAFLPHSRREALAIAELFPTSQVRLYLGAAATEVNAFALDRKTRIVHFAVHAHLDDRSPFDSALVLSPSPGVSDDGLLRAQEVFDGIRLDADLVVLSACATALGEQRGGEGLIGLTRAFQYAGARSVVATIWKVDDRVSAELMIRFYRRLREGENMAAALRGAKLELIQGSVEVRSIGGKRLGVDASAPVYWAGFELIGDWR